jgi:predicted nucleotidyltransferase
MKNIDLDKSEFFQKLKKFSFIEKIILYGSRARGDFKERSDIDLAIVCPSASQEDWMRVISVIEEADTLLKIDCVRLDTLSEQNPLRKAILCEGTELYNGV